MRETVDRWEQQNRKASAFLTRLPLDDREALAKLLEDSFISAVHETLVVLHQAGVPPFDDGYEGTPYHDFMGRLDGWEWPPKP